MSTKLISYAAHLASKQFPKTVYSQDRLSSVKVQVVIVSSCILLLPASGLLRNTHKCSLNNLKPLEKEIPLVSSPSLLMRKQLIVGVLRCSSLEMKNMHKYTGQGAKELNHTPTLQPELKTFRPHLYFNLIPQVSKMSVTHINFVG